MAQVSLHFACGPIWDWDDFTSINITDQQLEAIREEASRVSLPLTESGRSRLRDVLKQVHSMS
jgi:hypothetical protein